MAAFVPCLVVGCGYVGTRLTRREAPRRALLAIVRSGPHATELGATGVQALQLDLDSPGPQPSPRLVTAASGAAIVYLVPPPESGVSDPRLRNFLQHVAATRPTAFVYVSTTGVYGDTGGALVDESSPLAPANDRARRRVAAEAAVSTWCAARGVRCVVLRVPGIYGPHRLPLERLERGEPALRPEDAGPGNRVHVDDLVTTIVAAIDDPNAQGPYNVTDSDGSNTTEFLQAVATAAGLPAPRLVTRVEAVGQISPGLLAFLRESRRVDNRRLREDLGVALRHPTMQSGIRASLAEMLHEAPST